MKACIRILLLKLKECTNTIEMNQLIHEIRTALDNILNMYPSDPDTLSKLIIDKLQNDNPSTTKSPKNVDHTVLVLYISV